MTVMLERLEHHEDPLLVERDPTTGASRAADGSDAAEAAGPQAQPPRSGSGSGRDEGSAILDGRPELSGTTSGPSAIGAH
mmetsp:Transcript_123066/g.359294  ORF Transcript_123066/g.359294 Transcript_123066/m.359294 type:complete len:80 (+) Transcript_123066:1615-1854(+)